MSDAKTIAKEHGLTLADVAELIAPPKPRKWADLDDRTDEVAALFEDVEPIEDVEPYVAPAPVGELTDHKQPGRRVTAWFVRQ